MSYNREENTAKLNCFDKIVSRFYGGRWCVTSQATGEPQQVDLNIFTRSKENIKSFVDIRFKQMSTLKEATLKFDDTEDYILEMADNGEHNAKHLYF